jgi:catechol 2,3-dioxygenase-like lactoylglutathione lyase family enzyme
VTAAEPRLPAAPLTGLSHVQLLVSDVAASARWYAAALGLEPFAEDLGIGYVALRHRGSRVVVVLTAPSPSPVGSSPPGASSASAASDSEAPGPGSVDHLAFAVPDGASLEAWARHLDDSGIDHPGIALENGNPSLQLRDPDGLAIELVAPGGR